MFDVVALPMILHLHRPVSNVLIRQHSQTIIHCLVFGGSLAFGLSLSNEVTG
jgi:hypothetical protein